MLLYPGVQRIGVQPSAWLGDAAAAVTLTFDVDAESNLLSRGDHYLEHLSAVSHQQYGPRIAVPRLLAMLARQGVPATFFVPGIVAERWPETVAAILEAEHEVGLHGYRHLAPTETDPQGQTREFERGLRALERLGVRPLGYRTPGWELTPHTLRLLVEQGLLYDSSLMDDDRPYVLQTPWGRVAQLPPHWSLDDWEQYGFMPDPPLGDHIESPRKVLELWTDELDAMRETHSLLMLTCHPLLSGRPARARAIEHLIVEAQARGDVVFRRCDELARAVLAAEPLPYAAP